MNEFPRTPGPQGHDGEEQRMRRLLDEAVSDVEPREALGSIHQRTKVSSMQRKRSWLMGASAAVVATAATVAAVTVLSDGTPDGGSRPDAGPVASPSATPSRHTSPSPSEEPTASTEPPAPTMQAVPVYYVGESSRGPRLYREFHRVDTGGDPVSAAVAEAVSADPTDTDYRTDWPLGTTASAQGDGVSDVVTVDVQSDTPLRERPPGMTEDEAKMAVEQLIYTAQAALQKGRPGVQFLLNGERSDALLGVPVSEPLAQGDPADVLAQVWIIEPAEGAEVTAPFKVSGLAAAFEANVQWEVMEGDHVVKRGFTTAEECCTMAPYSFTLNLPPGEYTLVVHDTDESGGEGFAPWRDTKRVTVVP